MKNSLLNGKSLVGNSPFPIFDFFICSNLGNFNSFSSREIVF